MDVENVAKALFEFHPPAGDDPNDLYAVPEDWQVEYDGPNSVTNIDEELPDIEEGEVTFGGYE